MSRFRNLSALSALGWGGAILVSSTNARAVCDTDHSLEDRGTTFCLDHSDTYDPVNDVFTSYLDNPPLTGLKNLAVGECVQFSVAGGAQNICGAIAQIPTLGQEMAVYRTFLPFGRWSCSGDTSCDGPPISGSFLDPKIFPTQDGFFGDGSEMPWAMHGIKLGTELIPFTYTEQISGNPQVPLTSTNIDAFSSVLISPLNVVVVLPPDSGETAALRDSMIQFQPDYLGLLFDDMWSAVTQRFPSASLEAFVQFSKQTLPSELGATFRETVVLDLPLSGHGWKLPDDIFSQCGIQFRMKNFHFVEETNLVNVFRTQEGTAAGTPICGEENDAERDAMLASWVSLANAAGADPAMKHLFVAHRVDHPSCPSPKAGIHSTGVAAIGVEQDQTGLALSHTLGHMLGMQHPEATDATLCSAASTANRSLMCGDPALRNPHVQACQVVLGAQGSPLPNCVPDTAETIVPAATCARARENAGGGAPPTVTVTCPTAPVDCTGPDGASVTIDGNSNQNGTGVWFGDGTQIGQPQTGMGMPPTVTYQTTATQALGTSTYALEVTNNQGQVGRAECSVTVQDLDGPEFTFPLAPDPFTTCAEVSPGRFECEQITCTEEAEHTFTFTPPTVTDTCQPGAETVIGEVVALCDTTSPTCVPFDMPEPLTNNQFVLIPGESLTIRWTSSDGQAGTTPSVVEQVVNTRVALPVECPMQANQQRFEGTPGPDQFFLTVPAFVLGFGGNDIIVTTSSEPDFLAGMEGDDLLVAGPGDTLLGGPGDDVLVSLLFGFESGTPDAGADAPVIRMFGELDDDIINGSRGGRIEGYGILGNDVIIGSNFGDLIIPGPGRDHVVAGKGDDQVVLYDVCEIPPKEEHPHPGRQDGHHGHARATKVLVGGKGNDTLVTPVSLQELRALGAVVSGFETITVDTTKRRFSHCFPR
jgi:hypothetical protein